MVSSRPSTYLGVQQFAGAGLHTHAMSIPETTVPEELVDGARSLIDDFTRELPGRVGFVIYHRARPANFVLAHLWDGVDLVQRYWSSPLDDPQKLHSHRAGGIGCVWELDIIARERDAWAAICETPNAAETYLRRRSEAACAGWRA